MYVSIKPTFSDMTLEMRSQAQTMDRVKKCHPVLPQHQPHPSSGPSCPRQCTLGYWGYVSDCNEFILSPSIILGKYIYVLMPQNKIKASVKIK